MKSFAVRNRFKELEKAISNGQLEAAVKKLLQEFKEWDAERSLVLEKESEARRAESEYWERYHARREAAIPSLTPRGFVLLKCPLYINHGMAAALAEAINEFPNHIFVFTKSPDFHNPERPRYPYELTYILFGKNIGKPAYEIRESTAGFAVVLTEAGRRAVRGCEAGTEVVMAG